MSPAGCEREEGSWKGESTEVSLGRTRTVGEEQERALGADRVTEGGGREGEQAAPNPAAPVSAEAFLDGLRSRDASCKLLMTMPFALSTLRERSGASSNRDSSEARRASRWGSTEADER